MRLMCEVFTVPHASWSGLPLHHRKDGSPLRTCFFCVTWNMLWAGQALTWSLGRWSQETA